MLDRAGAGKRKMMALDVGTAYLNATMKRLVYMWIDKHMTSILIKMDPNLGKFVTEDGRMIVLLRKALYGNEDAGKLWYDVAVEFLVSQGYTVNPKDKCLYNKDTPDGQVSILFHVDDFLCFCESQKQLDILRDQFIERFKKVTVQNGPKITYLGMEIEILSNQIVSISMDRFIDDLIESFPVPDRAKHTPVSANLFEIDAGSDPLNPRDSETFHSVTASLLYLSLKVRKDIGVGVAFLTGRVQEPTHQDWDKLTHLMQYIKTTKDKKLFLGGNYPDMDAELYADASFGVHAKGNSHSGIAIKFGLGAIISKSLKQKMIAKYITEGELVSLSDGAAMAAWVNEVMYYQGIKSPRTKIFEDNQAAIILAEAGHPTSERSRHIKVRHFFVNQFLESKEMSIQHCKTADMIADILTKYIANPQFSKLCDLLLGYASPVKGVRWENLPPSMFAGVR